jgi:hypothetical protein
LLHFRIELPDDARRERDSEFNGLEQLLEREQITEEEALEWARQAAQDAAARVQIKVEGPASESES